MLEVVCGVKVHIIDPETENSFECVHKYALSLSILSLAKYFSLFIYLLSPCRRVSVSKESIS